ncbi:MAG: prepilin peptidase [candidate division Zixibacteria bacterium]|nr:prepilin peptidase [candidate division Zixibacteria bacterium]
MAELFLYLWIAGIGLIIGSFLNVLIYRIPRHIGFGMSRSFCPSCKEKISFYDNIPLLSYLILGGKCRHCRAKISFRYPLVEFLNGLGYLLFFWHFGPAINLVVYSVLTSILIAIFFIDIEFQIIPDMLTISGMALGLIASLLPGGTGIISASIGLAAGGGALYLMALLGDWLFKKESMGGGDIKMSAMLGAFLGWQKIIFIFFASAAIGLLISMIVMLFSRRVRSTRVIPFGPFLAIAAIIAIIYGDTFIDFYLRHFFRL